MDIQSDHFKELGFVENCLPDAFIFLDYIIKAILFSS